MSKRGYISRYALIIKKLRAKPYSSFEEIRQYFEHQLEFLRLQDEDLQIAADIRTFQRDLKEIRNTFGVDIGFSRKNGGYYILHEQSENMNFGRMMESYDLFTSLNLAHDLAPHIQAEERRPQGTEHLYGLLHAIRNNKKIIFQYQKFWDDAPRSRQVDPYALKEFRNRWYVLARDEKDDTIKSFALDRLTGLEITRYSFVKLTAFDVRDYYRYCYGVTRPNDGEPEEIILSFESEQGQYIKTLPLHTSQEILVDTEEEVRVKLYLFITTDLVMELLSYGDRMKVLQPLSLVTEMKRVHLAAGEQYKE